VRLTIALSIKVGEGLVLAADSTTSFFSGGNLAQSYHHARKLLQLEEYPVGVLTYGLGSVAGRNLESLVAEYERTLTPFQAGDPYTIQGLAESLHSFLIAKYDAVYPPPPPVPDPAPQTAGAEAPDPEEPAPVPAAPPVDLRPTLGVVIGGYSRGEFFSDEFEMRLPWSSPDEVWPDAGAPQTELFGVRWWGQTAPIERLYLGCDYRGFVEWCRSKGVPEEEIAGLYSELRERVAWPVIYEGMPLQDAIDLAVFLVNVTIGHSRFAVGPPVCGGEIDVATITSAGFQWISRKQHQVKTNSVFY
jgi:hypothetical protein